MTANTIFIVMISEEDLTKQQSIPYEERISRIEKLLEGKEKPRAFELGLLLALKMGQEIREKKPLGSTTAKMVAEWNRTYPSSLVEEAIASAKEFLMNPAKLAEKIKAGMKKIDEKRDDADKSDETESKDLSEGENG